MGKEKSLLRKHETSLQREKPTMPTEKDVTPSRRSLVQRGAGNAAVQRAVIARKAAGGGKQTSGANSALRAMGGSGGQPLEQGAREPVEHATGADLSGVRVHTDSNAAEAAQGLDALAFTYGKNIYFGAGQFQPQTSSGKALLAHELTHTVQQGHQQSVPPAQARISQPGEPQEQEADAAAQRASAGQTAPTLTPARPGLLQRQPAPAALTTTEDDDPDHPPEPQSAKPAASAEDDLEPLEDWNPEIDTWDQATFWTPPGTTREQIAQRLYKDRNHVGGFDIIGDKHVKMRNFEGVADDLTAAMRKALDERLKKDVDSQVKILGQTLIGNDDELKLLDTTVWWSSRGELTNGAKRSYFDAYLDALDTHKFTEGLVWKTTISGIDKLLEEAEEKKWSIYFLIQRRTGRSVNTDYGTKDREAIKGSITATAEKAKLGYLRVVGNYTYHFEDDSAGKEKEKSARVTGEISVGEQIVDETTATRAEIALRNSPKRGPRVMIPGGDGHFYGYTISYPHFWDEVYIQPTGKEAPHLDTFWWHYPGTVFIAGGEYQPSFGKGGEAENTQRKEILNKALADGIEALKGLDFDVLSLMTFEQRINVLDLASKDSKNDSLIARLLFSTPDSEFPTLERRISTNGTMERLITLDNVEGPQRMFGRIFTLKALRSMQVPGENLKDLPEFKVGFDEDGYYHYGVPTTANEQSKSVPNEDLHPGDSVGIGKEQAVPGDKGGTFQRTTLRIQPLYVRLARKDALGLLIYLGRSAANTLFVNDGPVKGPYLPTQLVRVTILGKTPQTRVVTALEAVTILRIPAETVIMSMLQTWVVGGVQIMAAFGFGRVFGTALGEGLAAGGGARAVGAALSEAAATKAGEAAISNVILLGVMELVDNNRDEISKTPDGRAFLELYDVTMTIWVAHDLARLITSGLIPRLVAAAEKVAALPGELRAAVMPLRDEAEAFRRAIKRFKSPLEAAEALTTAGPSMGVEAEKTPGFFKVLKITRGEVAAERAVQGLAGKETEGVGKRVFNRLSSQIERSEQALAKAGEDEGAAKAAEKQVESAANARLKIAQRAAQLRPEARDAFLRGIDEIIAARPNSLGSLTDLLSAAASSGRPNVFLKEVQTLVNRKGISSEALADLGRKVRKGKLDLAWLNRTKLSDETIDFLGRDSSTRWDIFQKASINPTDGEAIAKFRSAARGAGAEIAAAPEAEKLGTNVRRQVEMGTSVIDYEVTVAGRPHGFEVKGWIPKTWDEALDAAIKRLNHRALSDAERKAVRKIDHMLGQLQNAQAATKQAPFLGLTDALSEESRAKLERILTDKGLGSVKIVLISESAIKETSQGTIGAALGIPRP